MSPPPGIQETLSSQPAVFESDVPARLDRLPWSRFHRLVVGGARHHLDPRRARGDPGRLAVRRRCSKPARSISARAGRLTGSSYLAGAVLGALFFGHLTDRLGRKALFIVTLGVYLVATAPTAVSWNFESLRVFRFLTGAGIGGEYAAINSAIQELIPARLRGRTDLAINGSFWIGAALGALVSVCCSIPRLLAPDLGWRLAFVHRRRARPLHARLRRCLPESPRWLMTHGRGGEARRGRGRDRGARRAAQGEIAAALPRTRAIRLDRRDRTRRSRGRRAHAAGTIPAHACSASC